MRVMPIFWAMRPVRIICPSELDLDIDAGGEVELHQRIHCLRRRIDDIEHALVRAHFELLARLLVDVRRAIDRELLDPRRQRDRTTHLSARPFGRADDLTRRNVEYAMVEGLKPDSYVGAVDGHDLVLALCVRYFTILVTTPAPTVRPPSRMAKRRPSSMAIGWISSTVMRALSPGITISVPCGSVTTPVTSVVRK